MSVCLSIYSSINLPIYLSISPSFILSYSLYLSAFLAWSTSSMLRSCSPPFSGLYTSVPLMITVCAGRFTPHASVAVHTRTFASHKNAQKGKGWMPKGTRQASWPGVKVRMFDLE